MSRKHILCYLLLLGAGLLTGTAWSNPDKPQLSGKTEKKDWLGGMRITGHVLHRDNSGVPGVVVYLPGACLQTATDDRGYFSLQVPKSALLAMRPLHDSLEVELSYAALWTQRVKITNWLPDTTQFLQVDLAVEPERTRVRTELAIVEYPGADSSRDIPFGPKRPGVKFARLRHQVTYANRPSLPDIPLFPTRPPAPTEPEALLPPPYLAPARTLSEAATRLQSALRAGGYEGHTRYYAYPQGFALTTIAERTDERATPARADRWLVAARPTTSWISWLRGLLGQVPVGRFRVLVFIVTTSDVLAAPDAATLDRVQEWGMHGPGVLPRYYDTQPFTARHRCTVWVYELRKVPGGLAKAEGSGYGTLEQLQRSGIRPQP